MSTLGVNPCEECPDKQLCLNATKHRNRTDMVSEIVKENIRSGFAIRQQDDITKQGVFRV